MTLDQPTETQILQQIERIKNRLRELNSVKPRKGSRAEERSLHIRWGELNRLHYSLYGDW